MRNQLQAIISTYDTHDIDWSTWQQLTQKLPMNIEEDDNPYECLDLAEKIKSLIDERNYDAHSDIDKRISIIKAECDRLDIHRKVSEFSSRLSNGCCAEVDTILKELQELPINEFNVDINLYALTLQIQDNVNKFWQEKIISINNFVDKVRTMYLRKSAESRARKVARHAGPAAYDKWIRYNSLLHYIPDKDKISMNVVLQKLLEGKYNLTQSLSLHRSIGKCYLNCNHTTENESQKKLWEEIDLAFIEYIAAYMLNDMDDTQRETTFTQLNKEFNYSYQARVNSTTIQMTPLQWVFMQRIDHSINNLLIELKKRTPDEQTLLECIEQIYQNQMGLLIIGKLPQEAFDLISDHINHLMHKRDDKTIDSILKEPKLCQFTFANTTLQLNVNKAQAFVINNIFQRLNNLITNLQETTEKEKIHVILVQLNRQFSILNCLFGEDIAKQVLPIFDKAITDISHAKQYIETLNTVIDTKDHNTHSHRKFIALCTSAITSVLVGLAIFYFAPAETICLALAYAAWGIGGALSLKEGGAAVTRHYRQKGGHFFSKKHTPDPIDAPTSKSNDNGSLTKT